MRIPALALYVPAPAPYPLAFVSSADHVSLAGLSYPVFPSPYGGLGSQTTRTITAAIATAGGALLKTGNPYAMAAGAILELGAAIANTFHGCGNTCIQSTEFANNFQQACDQLVQYYFAQPVHYKSLQQATLDQLNQAASDLRTACSDPALGDAGKRCISERLDPNACKFKDAQGGCHNFYIDYIDKVQNDPNVVPDPPDADFGLTTSTGTLNWPVLAALGVGLVLLLTFVL